LRELTPSDLDNLMRILADPEAMRYWPSPMSREEGMKWIDRQRIRYVSDGCGYWACELKDSGEFVGQAGLLKQDVEGVTELGIGYMFIPQFWGRGYATEISQSCLAHGFSHYEVDHIVALIRPENEPSIRVAKRLKMSLWKTAEYYGFVHGVWRKER
jgi:RimJ/RimL family protein N-acetyltransferase